ncbi:MAG TPA: histidine--tRNA ligase [Trueperaceae bacterium]|nr:histidine--tRNA ligase [Trueperaceae bacterium]
MKSQAVKGTHDVLPEEQPAWRRLLSAAEQVLERAGARPLTTPVFEYSEVFEKSVGESADLIVQKEMYTFEDRGGRSLTLRPEFTAGVLRAFIEHGMHTLPTPVKLWSAGPLFRAENVQRGRYRQFHQINLEILGLSQALADAEAVQLMYATLRACGLDRVHMRVGSVGDPEDRAAYNAYLRAELEPVQQRLSETSRERLRLNPMRVLDSKSEEDQALVAPLERPIDFLGEAARAHLDQVLAFLRDWGVPFEIDPGIVRGLDYYRRTAFEAHYQGIGAQSALGGGGRYDGLVENLGGPPMPGVGWAMGVERVLDAMAQEALAAAADEAPELFLVPLDDAAIAEVAALAVRLRRSRRVEHAYVRRNPGKGLRDADRSGATFAGLRGEAERRKDVLQLKHMASGEQTEVPVSDLEGFLDARA